MAEYSAAMTLTTPGGTITFNGASDAFHNDPEACSGLDQAPLRVTTEERPRTSGGLIYPGLRNGRTIVLGGSVRKYTIATRTTSENGLIAALESIEAADGTLLWQPTSGNKTWTVRCLIPVEFQGNYNHRYAFTLYAANPNPS